MEKIYLTFPPYLPTKFDINLLDGFLRKRVLRTTRGRRTDGRLRDDSSSAVQHKAELKIDISKKYIINKRPRGLDPLLGHFIFCYLFRNSNQKNLGSLNIYP